MGALVLMIGYYGICFCALYEGGVTGQVRKLHRELSVRQRAVAVLAVVFGVVLTVYWMGRNQFVYYWDYGEYWRMSIQRMDYLFSHNILDALVSFFASVNGDDYNNFLPSVVALPLKIFGCEFSTYVLINHVMFLVPAVLVQGLCAEKLASGGSTKTGRAFSAAVVLGTLFPGNYYAMYQGYIDVAVLLPVSIAIYLLIDFDFRKAAVSKDIAAAAILLVAWISRRYVVYFIIGYVAALVVKAAVLLWKERNRGAFICAAKHFCIIGGVSIGALLIYFRQFLFRALATDYGEMYSAYNAPLLKKVRDLTNTFGLAVLLAAAAAGILCFLYKKNRANFTALLALTAAETIAFWQTQSMGVHHRMLVNVPLFLCCMLAWGFGTEKDSAPKKRRRLGRSGAAVLCSLVLALNFCQAMLPVSAAGFAKGLFSEKYQPMRRGDIDQLEALAEYLNGETLNTDQMIYVAASGAVLNCDILRKLYAPDTMNAVPNMYNTNDVDMRDGFPAALLEAEYIVTTDPVQTHLASGQEVVSYPAELIQDGASYMGRHFEEVRRFELDGGVAAKVYVRTSEWEPGDLEQMRDYFNALYPGYEEMFGGRIG